MAVVGFIPARGGSKSIPMKNIKLMNGKPLIYWSALALQECKEIDVFYVATDSIEIREVVLNFGFDKLKVYNRSSETAQDTSSTESVMLEFIEKEDLQKEDTFVLVQLTNPFIQANWISEAFIQYQSADSLLSASSSKRFFWNKKGEALNYDFNNRPRRQEFEGVLMENGAFYMNSVQNILTHKNRLSGKISVYEMPEYTGYEIDEPDDWTIVEALLKAHVKNETSFKFEDYQLIATDVDGVLTDASMYYTENGDELKKFCTYDGMAFQLFRDKGYKTAILTAENTKLVERRSNKMKIDFLFQGAKDKLTLMQNLCSELNISLKQVIYIGDDINDKALLEAVGLAFKPANAQKEVMSLGDVHLLSNRGGEGTIREIYNTLN
jgi:YrbI family 3-deoxy-D-manno-octulosonate 8-phosphate phosphatase